MELDMFLQPGHILLDKTLLSLSIKLDRVAGGSLSIMHLSSWPCELEV